MDLDDLTPKARGYRLKSAREWLGWTQAELANAVGTTQQTIDRIERGTVGHSRYLQPIAKALSLIETPVEAPSLGQHGLIIDSPNPLKDRQSQSEILELFRVEREGVVSVKGIDRAYRPPPLVHVDGAYGVYVPDNAMAPAFMAGDLAFVNPHIPVKDGCTVFARKLAEGGEAKFAFIESAEEGLQWGSGLKLQLEDWPILHVVIAHYLRP